MRRFTLRVPIDEEVVPAAGVEPATFRSGAERTGKIQPKTGASFPGIGPVIYLSFSPVLSLSPVVASAVVEKVVEIALTPSAILRAAEPNRLVLKWRRASCITVSPSHTTIVFLARRWQLKKAYHRSLTQAQPSVDKRIRTAPAWSKKRSTTPKAT